jgi:chorismate mutase
VDESPSRFEAAPATRLAAVRGATTVEHDTPGAIVDATAELLGAMMSRNGVHASDLVSMLFTATPDLRAEFPAAAARRLGLSDVPLMCAVEIDVEGSVARCVRVLAHLYSDRGKDALRHVYLRGATRLRGDTSR